MTKKEKVILDILFSPNLTIEQLVERNDVAEGYVRRIIREEQINLSRYKEIVGRMIGLPEVYSETQDRFKAMFGLQKIFQRRIYDDVDELPEEMIDKIPMQITSIISELGEILEEHQGWKDHRSNVPEVNRENLRDELVDVLHFFINLCLYLGYDAEDIFQGFVGKNEVNHDRQDNNY